MMVWFEDGTFSECAETLAVKTDRHIDISDLLKEEDRR